MVKASIVQWWACIVILSGLANAEAELAFGTAGRLSNGRL